MDNQQQINPRQIAWLTGTIIIGEGIISLPHNLMDIAQADAWFSQLFPTFYAMLCAYLIYVLHRHFPQKHIFEINTEVLGRWGGGCFNALILFYFWAILARDLSGLTNIIESTLLQNTPREITLLLFILLLMYYGKTSVEVPARVNDFFFPMFIILNILLPLMLANEIILYRAEPVLATNLGGILKGSYINTGWFADIFVLAAFMHTVTVFRPFHSAMRHGILVSATVLTALTLLTILVLGVQIAARTLFPNYTLIEMIQISDFLDRLEVFVFSIWVPLFAMKLIVIYLAIIIGLSHFAGGRDYRTFNLSTAWLVLITSFLGFRAMNETLSFGNFSASLIAACVQLPLFALLFLFIRMKKAKKSRSQTATKQDQTSSPSGSPEAAKSSSQTWFHITNGLIAICLGAILLGLVFGKDVPLIGTTCGGIYFLCLFASALTSYMELKQMKDSRAAQ